MATPGVSRLVDLALEEDLGRGDCTTAALVPDGIAATANLAARHRLVVAGLEVADAVFRRLDPQVVIEGTVRDGDEVAAGTVVRSYRGAAAALLSAERTALNFVQRLSGTATLTRTYVAAAAGSNLRITDTRKTTPGFRLLEKYAVRMGGGSNHRFDLGAGVLIKDNHLVVTTSIAEAIRKARAHVPHGLKVEVEVDTLAQLDQALAAGADIVLLDNFTLTDVETAVARARTFNPRPLLEVSGGVTLARIPELARVGVDLVSVGALTHSAPAADLGLDFEMVQANFLLAK